MAHVPVRPHQVRPHHTGTARVESLKAQAQAGRVHHQPTHLRMKNAAVAVARVDGETPAPRAVRWARRPLALPQGRVAVALRQVGEQAIEVLVRTAAGQQGWRSLEKAMAPEMLRVWLREGFG